MFSEIQKTIFFLFFFERKAFCSLSKKNSHYINERADNQIIKNQAITTQSTLSMKAKTKSKPISLLNANENVLSNQQANEKHQALNSQPITGS
jgi:hypothetical protein